MTSSGTYTFDPAIADLVLDAFDRIQIRPAAITQDHMASARRSANQIQVRWSNRGINLWLMDEQVITLVSGTTDYTLSSPTIADSATVAVYETWFRQNPGLSTQVDTFLQPISRTDWATIAVKNVAVSVPTSYYFDRTDPPKLHLYGTPTFTTVPVPQLHFYRMRQLQDAVVSGATTADIPYRFEEAYCADLAYMLAMKWKPPQAKELLEYSKEVWKEAAGEDRERVVLNLAPRTDSYYR